MRGWRVALGALALGVSTAAMAAPAERADPTFTGRDLFDLSVASDPQISPDGRKIAYVRRSADIMTDRMVPSIWLVDVDTGEQRPIATTGSANASPPGRLTGAGSPT
jgi:dipeptidyl aminopeptidase/acylaminoacyl peptidase